MVFSRRSASVSSPTVRRLSLDGSDSGSNQSNNSVRPQPRSRQGDCPVCVRSFLDILRHIRRQHDHGRGLSHDQTSDLGFLRCGQCDYVLLPSGVRNHACFSGRPVHLIDIADGVVCLKQTASEVVCPLRGARRVGSAPPPASQDPLAFQVPAPQVSAPASPPVPMSSSSGSSAAWFSSLGPQDLGRFRLLRKVPFQSRTAFAGALDRTCQRIIDSGYSADSVKLLFLLPLAFHRWPGQRRCAVTNRCLSAYPDLQQSIANDILLVAHNSQASIRRPQQLDSTDEDYATAARAKHVAQLVSEGSLRKAARALLSDGVADLTDDNFETLKRLHPAQSSQAFGAHPPRSNNVPPSELKTVISALPLDSAPGPSGWTYAMVRSAWALSSVFQRVLKSLCVRLLNGQDCGLREWFTMSRLIPLKKGSSGVRPIACGETFTRIAARWALTGVNLDEALLPCQFGVGTRGGVEPMVWAIRNDIVQHGGQDQDLGVLAVDFTNAFNSVSRSVMDSMVREHAPSIWTFAKLLYGAPSLLFVRDGNDNRVIESCEGTRQGDPLGPLLFSLALRPLLERLIAEGVSVRAYLDDLHISPISTQQAVDLIQHINSLPVATRGGLLANPNKCRFYSFAELVEVGGEFLGTVVGGPEDQSNVKALSVMDTAVQLFRQRIDQVAVLGLQQRLLLLRYCFFPVFSHFLRTMPPSVTLGPAYDFDKAVQETLTSWFGKMSAPFIDVAQLPVRLGGLGLFSQVALRAPAYASSYIESQHTLRVREFTFCDEATQLFSHLATLCTDNLNWPDANELMAEPPSHLQKRVMERVHSEQWFSVFQCLPGSLRARFVENGERFARGWLHAVPSFPLLRLTDTQVQYAVRRTLLQQPQDAGRWALDTCACGRSGSDLHHLACSLNQHVRTFRHTEILRTLAKELRNISDDVRQEHPLGGMRHDILYLLRGDGGVRPHLIDVSIATVRYAEQRTWPSQSEVSEAVEADYQKQVAQCQKRGALAPRRKHRAIETARALWRLARGATVESAIHACEQRKLADYQHRFQRDPGDSEPNYQPFVLTAGGGVSRSSAKLLKMLSGKDIQSGQQMAAKFGVTLLKAAARMAREQAMQVG